MYGHIWKRAGNFRKTNKNIGVEYWKIFTELKMLLDDCKIEINIPPNTKYPKIKKGEKS